MGMAFHQRSLPFNFLGQTIPVLYHLSLPANYYISSTFHISLLKPAGGPRGVEEVSNTQSPPPLIMNGKEAYDVRELLNSSHFAHRWYIALLA